MSNVILHITNGDSTTNYLKKLAFSGNFITWREMLCEGKTINTVGSEAFWKTRFNFLKSSYKVTKKTFTNYTLKEYQNLCNVKECKEIVLWFEYDLFCQINLLAVISWLKNHRKNDLISLVCSGNIKGSEKLVGLSELNPAQIQEHYKKRIQLSQEDIEYGDYIWQLYCAKSPLRLQTIYQLKKPTAFQYLSTALNTHLQRFPSIENGLNNVENFVLEIANTTKPRTKKEFINQLLKKQETYGFGDLQYENTIHQLKKAFTSFNPLEFSKKGKQLLENQINFYRELHTDNLYLGGSKKYCFLYNHSTKKLLQISS